MKKQLKWLVVVGVLVLTFGFFFSCSNEELQEFDQQALEDLGLAMSAAFSEVDFEGGENPGTITLTPPNEETGCITVTWTGYTDPTYGITVSGSLTFCVTVAQDGSSMTARATGTLNFTGAASQVDTVGWDVTITMTNLTSPEPTITISGWISLDGVKYAASGFTDITSLIPSP